MNTCLISFGANIPGPFGNPRETLSNALKEFKSENLLIKKKSRFYLSLAFPDPRKPAYVNGCAQISVNLSPSDVIDRLMSDPARGCDSRQETDQAYFEVWVGDGHLKLVKRSAVEENRESVQPWFKTFSGQSCGKPHHVLLSHSH